jgi:beta-lactam-binding protein with PASTA domain
MIKTFFKIVFYFMTFLAVGVLAAYLVIKIVDVDDKSEVPLLVGKNINEAGELLNERKLFMIVEGKEHSENVREGHILKQNIEQGKRIRIGTEVGVILSQGSAMYSMPSFEGQFLKDAKLTLVNLGMTIKKITSVHSDTVENGRIIAQRPLQGNIESNEINFLVSLGPYEVSYKCPSFVNMTVEDARIVAKELGVDLIEKDKGSRVIFQKPAAGVIIKTGDSIEITLGRGWGMWF